MLDLTKVKVDTVLSYARNIFLDMSLQVVGEVGMTLT